MNNKALQTSQAINSIFESASLAKAVKEMKADADIQIIKETPKLEMTVSLKENGEKVAAGHVIGHGPKSCVWNLVWFSGVERAPAQIFNQERGPLTPEQMAQDALTILATKHISLENPKDEEHMQRLREELDLIDTYDFNTLSKKIPGLEQ